MINPDFTVASERWFGRKGDIGTFPSMMLPLIFFLIQSLHSSWKTFTLTSHFEKPDDVTSIKGKNRFTTNFFPSPENYSQLRAILSFLGDINDILSQIKDEKFHTLKSDIISLYSEINKYKQLRNFFTHLDNVVARKERHGISGEHKTAFGYHYTKDADNCFHLMVYNDIIYFTYMRKCREIYLGKSALEPIFEITRNIYNKMLKEIEHDDLPTAEKILPL